MEYSNVIQAEARRLFYVEIWRTRRKVLYVTFAWKEATVLFSNEQICATGVVLLLKRAMRHMLSGSSASLATWLVLSQLLAAGTSFLVNIIAAFALEPTQRGLLAFFLQVGYFLTIAALFGTERPFIKLVREDFHSAVARFVRIVTPGYYLPILIALVAIISYILGYSSGAQTALWLFVLIIGNMHLRIVRAAFIASGSWKTFIAANSITQLLTLLLAVGLAVLEMGNFTVWLAGYALALLTPSLWVGRSFLIGRTGSKERSLSKRSVRIDGLKLLPASLGNTAMFRSDRLLLPILANPAQLGLYIVVAAALEVAVWPVQQWADSSLNVWKNRPDKDRTRDVIKLMLKSGVTVAGISCFLAILLWLLITLILPSEYSQSLVLIPPLIVANILYGATRVQQGLAIAAGKNSIVSIAEIAGMGVSVICFLVLIPMMGAMGAAIGSIVGYTVCLLVGFIGVKLGNSKSEVS